MTIKFIEEMALIQPWHWAVFGIVLVIAEMFVPTFFLLWFGVAALSVAVIVLWLGLDIFGAVIIWLILSVLLCVLWFYLINPKIKTKTKSGLGAGVIVGETGMIVIVPNINQAGRIRFSTPKAGASEWACRSRSDEVLEIGDRAVIVGIMGNELLVSKK